MKRVSLLFALVVGLALAATGCTLSTSLADSTGTADGYKELGEGTGSSTGVFLFGLFPLAEGAGPDTARQMAILSRQGNGLVNATMQSKIIHLFIIEIEIVTVKGQVIQK